MAEFKARPTVYKGIKMRSRLEAGYAAWLDSVGIPWEYEPEAFASPLGQYLPDFLVQVPFVEFGPEPCSLYIEVKPSFAVVDYKLMVSARSIIFENDPSALFLLAVKDGWPEFGARWATLAEPVRNPATGKPAMRMRIWAEGLDESWVVANPRPRELGAWPDGYWKPT